MLPSTLTDASVGSMEHKDFVENFGAGATEHSDGSSLSVFSYRSDAYPLAGKGLRCVPAVSGATSDPGLYSAPTSPPRLPPSALPSVPPSPTPPSPPPPGGNFSAAKAVQSEPDLQTGGWSSSQSEVTGYRGDPGPLTDANKQRHDMNGIHYKLMAMEQDQQRLLRDQQRLLNTVNAQAAEINRLAFPTVPRDLTRRFAAWSEGLRLVDSARSAPATDRMAERMCILSHCRILSVTFQSRSSLEKTSSSADSMACQSPLASPIAQSLQHAMQDSSSAPATSLTIFR